MKPHRVGVALALLLAVGGCAKQAPVPPPPPSVPIVAENERSRYFEAVNQHLEVGGTLYGYADVDGDSLKLADNVRQAVGRLADLNPAFKAGANLDYRAIFTALGLDDIKALGFSSVRGADGAFRNREFFYTPAGRHGLLAVVGGPPAAFTRTHLAPVDADFYCENEVDLPVVYATVKDVAAKLGQPGAADGMDVQVKAAGVKLGLSLLDLIGAWRGRVTIVARADPQEAYTLPAPLRIAVPKYSALVCIDGIGTVIEGDLAKSDAFTQTTEGTRHFFTPKKPWGLEGLHPILAVDGAAFYLATSPGFLREALDRQAGLEQNPDFQRMLAVLGPTGNGVSYATPRLFSQLREFAPLNQMTLPQLKSAFAAFGDMPVPARPLMAVRVNLADGILVRSSFNRSLKKDLALLAIYNPVTVALGVALIVPAIQRAQGGVPPVPQLPVRSPAAPSAAAAAARVQANLRVLWTLSNRYYRQNQATTATYDDLIGPGKTLPRLQVWAGEDYRSIVFEKGQPISVRTRDGRVFTYPATPPPPRPAETTPPQ